VVLTWQTSVQRVLAAKDSATGRRIYTRTSFFFACRFLIPALWGIAALAVLTPEGSVAARNHLGGTAPAQVREAVKRARARLQED